MLKRFDPTSPAALIAAILAGLAIAAVLLVLKAEVVRGQEATVGNSVTVEVSTYTKAPSADFEICLESDDARECYVLNDGESHTFADLEDGRYELYVGDAESGWQVRSFRCDPRRSADLIVRTETASIRLDGDGDHFECKYVFEKLEPTATPTAAPAPTSTAVPAPTQAPPTILVACPGTTTLVNLTNGQTCPTSVPAVAPTAASPPVQPGSTIKPPATGSAGLR